MAEIVTIRPRAGSKRFKAIKGQMTQFQKITEQGQNLDRQAGEYKQERFPNSRQMFRPLWSSTKRKFLIKDLEDNSVEFNKIVEKCKLRYPKNHPFAGQYIKEADIYDPGDPFFTHKSLKVITYEGQITLDKKRPLDNILLRALLMNHLFQQGGESLNPALSSRVRYVITDKNIDAKIKKKSRSKIVKATSLYEKLTDNKKMKIAMAMGLISNEHIDRDIIDEVLWEASQNNRSKIAGKTKQDLFIAMCAAKTDELNTRHMIQKAKASGKLKKSKEQGWLLFGEAIGRTDGQLFKYFASPENQEMLLRLEQALEDDQSN